MELKILIISQLVLDLLILGILVVMGRLYLNRKAVRADFQSSMDRAMDLIKEMEALGASLQEILGEKRKLATKLMADLDAKLQKADRIREEIENVTKINTHVHGQPRSGRDMNKMHTTKGMIRELLSKGLSKEDISKQLGLAGGELDLIMKLDGPQGSGSKGSEKK